MPKSYNEKSAFENGERAYRAGYQLNENTSNCSRWKKDSILDKEFIKGWKWAKYEYENRDKLDKRDMLHFFYIPMGVLITIITLVLIFTFNS